MIDLSNCPRVLYGDLKGAEQPFETGGISSYILTNLYSSIKKRGYGYLPIGNKCLFYYVERYNSRGGGFLSGYVVDKSQIKEAPIEILSKLKFADSKEFESLKKDWTGTEISKTKTLARKIDDEEKLNSIKAISNVVVYGTKNAGFSRNYSDELGDISDSGAVNELAGLLSQMVTNVPLSIQKDSEIKIYSLGEGKKRDRIMKFGTTNGMPPKYIKETSHSVSVDYLKYLYKGFSEGKSDKRINDIINSFPDNLYTKDGKKFQIDQTFYSDLYKVIIAKDIRQYTNFLIQRNIWIPDINKYANNQVAIEQFNKLKYVHDKISNYKKAILEEKRTKTQNTQQAVQQPVQEQPVQEQPVQEQPVQEQPVQEQPVQEQPVQEQPVQEQPVQEQPVQEPRMQDTQRTVQQSETQNIQESNQESKSELQVLKETKMQASKENEMLNAQKEKILNEIKMYMQNATPEQIAKLGGDIQAVLSGNSNNGR